MMGFLAALPSEYDSTKAQILSSLEISSFKDTFSRTLHTEISSLALPSVLMNSVLVGCNIGESGKQQCINNDPRGNN